MKQEMRILHILGLVEDKYIEEAEPGNKVKKKYKILSFGIAVAAGLMIIAGVWSFSGFMGETPGGHIVPSTDIPSVVQPPESSQHPAPAIEKANDLHMVQLSYAPEPEKQDASDFIIYVNKERYRSYEKDGAYLIYPLIPISGELPECSLEIMEISDTTPSDTAQLYAEKLQDSFLNLSEISGSTLVDGLFLHADNGTEWNAKQLDVYFVDNLLGGTYVLLASYFTEAAEGHGARFADMVGTFKVLKLSETDTTPKSITQLRNTVDMMIPAVFSNQITEVGSLLAENAGIFTYDENVMDDVSIRSIDYAVDDYEMPSTAVVSVKHRLGTEDAYNYLTMELSYENGGWLVRFAGIER